MEKFAVPGLLLFLGLLYLIFERVMVKPEADAHRKRVEAVPGEGMARIADLETRTVRWTACGSTWYREGDEFTLHAGEALIARYWLGPHGSLAEVETSEGRWPCRWWGVFNIRSVRIRRPEPANERAEFTFDVRSYNQIRLIKFPDGSEFTLRYVRDGSGSATRAVELCNGEGLPVLRCNGGAGTAAIDDPGWASALRRDIILIGCFGAIHNQYYYEDGSA